MKKTNSRLYFLIFVCALLLDRITKFIAVRYLPSQGINLFSGFNLSVAWNRGISWGLLNTQSHVGYLILTTFICFLVLTFAIYTIREFLQGHPIVFETLILAGAVSNILDRLFYGGVIDFIDFYVYVWHWPTFNIADVCIVIGIIGIAKRISSCK